MIILDGKNISEFGFEVEPGQEDPITPVFEHKTIAIPGRPGLWDFGTEIRERPFSFNLKIMDRLHDRMQSAFNELVAFLFDEYGKPREIKVIRGYEPDKFITAKVLEQLIPDRLTEEGNLVLPFIAYDPYKHANVETHEIHWDSTTATYDDSWSIDTVFVDDVVINAPQTLETYVNGLALIPDILISGSGNNVTFSVNGKSFTLKNFTNSTFEIRGKDFVVLKNGVDTLTELTGDFMVLLPGLNKIQITGSNMNFNLSIRVRDKYN